VEKKLFCMGAIQLRARARITSHSANGLDFSFADADDVNGNSFVCSGHELILIHNDHATDAATVAIASAPDPYGRTKDIATYCLAAGEFAAFWIGRTTGWRWSDGKVHLDVAGAGTIRFAILRIPD
jgi:hypothetical protein